jgi:uncharacterized UBP type Zn finger protein
MPFACSHLPAELDPPRIESDGCEECLAVGRNDWVHLRFCQACGHVGCCDNSPGKHATAHFPASQHPVIRSFEPGEDWWYCYADDEMFLVDGAPAAPSYPTGT